MKWYWIISAVVAIVVAYWLTTVAIGLLAPLEFSARSYLRKRLRQLGVGGAIPDDCIRELAEGSVKLARFSTLRGENLRTNVVRLLDADAELVAVWVDGSQSYDSEELQVYRNILERHGVQRRVAGPRPDAARRA